MASLALAVLDVVAARRPASPKRGANIGLAERAGSALTGAALLYLGVRRRSVGGLIAGAVGGALLSRGVRGRSRLYEVVGISTAQPTGRVERTVTVNRSPEEVYAFCRDWTNLPRLMPRVLAVTPTAAGATVWLSSTGGRVEPSAVTVVADTPGEIFSWRHADGSSGAFRLQRAPAERGTEVRLALERSSVAEVDEVLRRLKQLIETGEIATTDGQPAGPPPA